MWTPTAALAEVNTETAAALAYLGLTGMERAEASSLSYGGQRVLDMGLALATRPRLLLLDEPLAGLAAGERQRIASLVKNISTQIPILLVEHDIDRVFQIADRVTVMNDGRVLVDGSVETARNDEKVRQVYIGSGAATLAAEPRDSAAGAEVLLAVDNVDTFYGKSHILDHVSFDLRQHEILALLGRNGAGKSTLLKTLTGIAPPSAGSIRLDGRELAGRPSASIARAGIGYVPQGRGLFAGMSVADNLALGRLKRRRGPGIHWDDERIQWVFPRLRERWHTPADYLSGGEQQMVAVARALAGNVRVLLLDEPFEGLSPAVTEELFEAFDRLRHEIAIVIVDHHLDLALALSDRTVVLERGAVAWTWRTIETAQRRSRSETAESCGWESPTCRRRIGSHRPRLGHSVRRRRLRRRGVRFSRRRRRQCAIALVMEGLADLAKHGLVADPKGSAGPGAGRGKTVTDALDGATSCRRARRRRVEAKRAIFAELDGCSADDAILASSTSRSSRAKFTEGLTGRARCLVAHPVNPPHLVPIVELVAAPWTAPETMTQAQGDL